MVMPYEFSLLVLLLSQISEFTQEIFHLYAPITCPLINLPRYPLLTFLYLNHFEATRLAYRIALMVLEQQY
jgi:hypothetical protein